MTLAQHNISKEARELCPDSLLLGKTNENINVTNLLTESNLELTKSVDMGEFNNSYQNYNHGLLSNLPRQIDEEDDEDSLIIDRDEETKSQIPEQRIIGDSYL